MKKLAIPMAFLAVPFLAYAATLKFGQWVVVNSSAATPVQLTNSSLVVNSLTLIGKKSYQTTNTTAVYVGFSSANGEQGISIDPGASVVIKDVTGNRTLSVSNIWLDVTTANDGVVVIYD